MWEGINGKSLTLCRDGHRLLRIKSVTHYMDRAEEYTARAGDYELEMEVLGQEGDICLRQDRENGILLRENTDYWIEFDEGIIGCDALLDGLLVKRNGCTGILNSQNYVGYLDEGCFTLLLPIEFISKKLSYEEDFSYLQTELTDFFYGLVDRGSSFFGRYYEKSDELLSGKEMPYSQLAYLKSLFRPDRLPEWVEYLLYHGEHSFLEETAVVPGAWAEEITPEALINALRPDNLSRGRSCMCGYYPRELECRRMVITYDTPENRFVKFFLEFLLEFLEELGGTKGKLPTGWKIRHEINDMCRILKAYLEHPFWKEIGRMEKIPGNSQILQRKYPYQLLFSAYHNLELRPKMKLNELDEAYVTGQKDAPMLYQYFVFLKLFGYLGQQYPQKSLQADFIKYQEDGLDFTLREGNRCRAVFEIGGNRSLRLYYNKTYHREQGIFEGRSYSHSLKPDISLELFEREGLLGIVHFDAKYKVPKNGRWEEEDMNKMHAYKDGIMGSIGAYAICLSEEKCLFVEEEYGMLAQGQLFPSVGAFPLHPRESLSVKQLSDIFALVEAFTRLPSGAGNIWQEGVRRSYRALERKWMGNV